MKPSPSEARAQDVRGGALSGGFQIQMSELQSPPGYRSSWARAGPRGSFPKSTRKLGFNFSPPFTVSTSICSITEPSLVEKGKGISKDTPSPKDLMSVESGYLRSEQGLNGPSI